MSENQTGAPWLEHGLLEVCANGHYIQHADGTPFLWVSDTQWVLNKLKDEDILRVLDDRKAKGFSVIQVCAVRCWNNLVWSDEDMSWANSDANGQLPFVDDDVTRLNSSYWDRWRKVIELAADRGLYVMLMAGSPGRKEAPWFSKDIDECYRYGQQIGSFFKGVPNLLYSASMDFEGTMGVGVEGWRAIARGIQAGDGGKDCFITYHPYTSSSKWFHQDQWLKVNGIQGSRNETPDNDILIYQRIRADYSLDNPVKPVVLLEGSYEDERNGLPKLPPTTPRNVRMQFFYAFFAGAAGYTYGHCFNWQQFASIDHLDSPGARQIAIAMEFLAGRDWWNLRPDQSVLTDGEGEGERRRAAVLAQDGSECLVFFPEQEEASIDLGKLGGEQLVKAAWFNPVEGYMLAQGSYPASGAWCFMPPNGWQDAVLVLQRGCANPIQ